MARRPGIADLPMEGTEFGQLNPISDPVIQDRIDSQTTNIFDAAKVAATERYVPDRLAKRGTFKAVVLKVLPPPPEPEGWLRSFFEPLGIRPPVLVRCRVRIPELHAAIPQPSELGDTVGPHQAIIEMHPVAIAESDTLPVPAVGSIVECQFDDLSNQDGLKYISAVGESTQNSSGGGGSAADQAISAAYQFAQTGQCGGLAAMGPMGLPMGVSAGSYTSLSTPPPVVNNARRARYIEQLIRLGGFPDARQGDVAYEQVPYPLVEEMILNGEIGLLALFIGAANWGISDLPAGIGDDPLLRSWGPYTPSIPGVASLYEQARAANRLPENSWPGKRASSGKHVMDGPGGPNSPARGGIGIAHFDSSTMTEWYDILGPSPVPPELKEISYDQMNPETGGSDPRVTPQIWQSWKQWCLGLVTSLEKQIYMCNHWVEDFFELERNGGDIAKTIVNSRVSNSVSGVARGVAGQSIDAQIQRYHNYKLERRGQDSAERAVRQAHYALRVVQCLEYVLENVPDAEATIIAAMSAPPEPRPEAAQQPIVPSGPLYDPMMPPPDGSTPSIEQVVHPASDEGYIARVDELLEDEEDATGIRIFVAGDPNSPVVVHYFGGYGHKITGDRDSALRNVMGSMPPNIFTIGWGIGDYTGEDVGSRYRGDANLVQFFDALEKTTATWSGLRDDPPELVYNTIETQARIIQGGPPSATRFLDALATATRPTIRRVLLFYSGGYNVFKKLYDLEVLQRADSGVYGLGFLDSLYSGNDYIRDLAANTNIKIAAVHNESAEDGGEDPDAFNRELQSLGRIGIRTDTSHSSIPKEFAANIVQMMLAQSPMFR